MAKKMIPFYNVENSVGKGGANVPDDVLLVQFFLSEVAKAGGQFPVQPPKEPLNVNGVATPLLNEWILWFQNAVKALGKTVTADGRIDPAKMHGGNDIYQGRGTIQHLNITYRKRYKQAHNSLEDSGNCPWALRLKFVQDIIG